MKNKRNKFLFYAAFALTFALSTVFAFLPENIADAEAEKLLIQAVSYDKWCGLTVVTDDFADEARIESELIAVTDKNGDEHIADAHNCKKLPFAENTVTIPLKDHPSPELLSDGKIVFKNDFSVSEYGKKIDREQTWTSSSFDEDLGIVDFTLTNSESDESDEDNSGVSFSGGKGEKDNSCGEFVSETDSDDEKPPFGLFESDSDESSEMSSGENESCFGSETESDESESESAPLTGESERSSEQHDNDTGKSPPRGEFPSYNDTSGEKTDENANEPNGKTDESADEPSGNPDEGTAVPENDEPTLIEFIGCDKEVIEVTAGETFALTVTVLPENATEKYAVKITPQNIIAYDGSVFKSLAAGEAEISFEAENITKTIKVTVLAEGKPDAPDTPDAPETPYEDFFVETSVEILLFGTAKLNPEITPENATVGEFYYSSDNPEIATVASDGTITAVSRGKCAVTVTLKGYNGVEIVKQVEVSVYDEITDIKCNSEIVLRVGENGIKADDIEFVFTYKSGLVVTKTIQNATLGYVTEDDGTVKGLLSFTEDGEDYSFYIPVSFRASDCESDCENGCASEAANGVFEGYSFALLIAVAVTIIKKLHQLP